MDILHEIEVNNDVAIRLFTSNALQRKDNIRIHYHTMLELSLVLSGKGLYKTNAGSTQICENDIFLFRPNEMHYITDIEKDGMILLNLHVSPTFIFTYFPNALNSSYLKILNMNFPLNSNKLNDLLPENEIKRIQELIFSIKSEFLQKQSDYLTLSVNYICNIFIILSRLLNSDKKVKTNKKGTKKILSAITYIDEHFDTPIALDAIASKIGYTRCYFSHIFKEYMGMSVWEYICIKRIEKALMLIKTTEKKIIDIAFECGFNNTANFNKTFKKYTNTSPNTFRN